MAYTGKQTANDMYEFYTAVFRHICGDSTVAGRDWRVIRRTLNTDSGIISLKRYRGTLSSIQLDKNIPLPTGFNYNYAFGKSYSEVLANANGSTKTFSYTVQNTPIHPYSIRIHFKIGNTDYYAYDNGSGSITGSGISSGTVNYTNGTISITFSTAPDSNTQITIDYLTPYEEGRDYTIDTFLGYVKFLSTGRVSSGSNVDYYYNFRPERVDLRNTGTSGEEDIFFVLSVNPVSNESQGYLVFNLYTNFVNGSYVDYTGDLAIVFWGLNSIDYWIFSNKNRIIFVAKSGNYYSSGYIGNVIRFAPPSEYKYPIVAVASHNLSVSYDDVQDTTRAFLCAKSYYYKDVVNSIKKSDYNPNTYNDANQVPYFRNYGKDLLAWNYPPDVKKAIFQMALIPTRLSVCGFYDGVYVVMDNTLRAEDRVVDENNNSYLVIPDVFRTNTVYYYLIKEE